MCYCYIIVERSGTHRAGLDPPGRGAGVPPAGWAAQSLRSKNGCRMQEVRRSQRNENDTGKAYLSSL